MFAALRRGTCRARSRCASLLLRQGDHLLRILARGGERFLAAHVLARLKRLECNLGVRLGHSQIHHDFDLGIGKQVFEGHRSLAEFFGLRAGARHVDIRDFGDADVGEFAVSLEIDRADVAGADDADGDGRRCHVLECNVARTTRRRGSP